MNLSPRPNGQTKVNPFPSGNPDDPNSDAFRTLYAIAKSEGDRRFGSECEHAETKDGVCLNCWRKVVTS
jgi:hypothetical protein